MNVTSWSVKVSNSIIFTPEIIYNIVYLFSSQTVTAVTIYNGSILWKKNLLATTIFQPSISKDFSTILASYKNSVHGLNIINGESQYLLRFNRTEITTSSVACNSLFVFGTNNSEITAITTKGSLSWRFQTDSIVIISPSVDWNNYIYFGTVSGSVYSIDSTGSLLFSSVIRGPVQFLTVVVNSMATVLYTSENTLYALTTSGSQIWWYAAPCQLISQVSSSNDGNLYFGCSSNSFFGFQGVSVATGTLSVAVSINNNQGLPSYPVIGCDNNIYYSTSGGHVVSIEPISTGKITWQYVNLYSITDAPFLSDGMIYFGDNMGYLYSTLGPPSLVQCSVTIVPSSSNSEVLSKIDIMESALIPPLLISIIALLSYLTWTYLSPNSSRYRERKRNVQTQNDEVKKAFRLNNLSVRSGQDVPSSSFVLGRMEVRSGDSKSGRSTASVRNSGRDETPHLSSSSKNISRSTGRRDSLSPAESLVNEEIDRNSSLLANSRIPSDIGTGTGFSSCTPGIQLRSLPMLSRLLLPQDIASINDPESSASLLAGAHDAQEDFTTVPLALMHQPFVPTTLLQRQKSTNRRTQGVPQEPSPSVLSSLLQSRRSILTRNMFHVSIPGSGRESTKRALSHGRKSQHRSTQPSQDIDIEVGEEESSNASLSNRGTHYDEMLDTHSDNPTEILHQPLVPVPRLSRNCNSPQLSSSSLMSSSHRGSITSLTGMNLPLNKVAPTLSTRNGNHNSKSGIQMHLEAIPDAEGNVYLDAPSRQVNEAGLSSLRNESALKKLARRFETAIQKTGNSTPNGNRDAKSFQPIQANKSDEDKIPLSPIKALSLLPTIPLSSRNLQAKSNTQMEPTIIVDTQPTDSSASILASLADIFPKEKVVEGCNPSPGQSIRSSPSSSPPRDREATVPADPRRIEDINSPTSVKASPNKLSLS